MHTVTLPLGFNWHNHFRSGPLLDSLMIHTLRHFGGSNAMPNIKERPIRTAEDVLWYITLLRTTAVHLGFSRFRFSIAVYVTPDTTPPMILEST